MGLPSIVEEITNLPDTPSSQSVIVTASPLISYFKLGLRDTSSVGLTSSLTSTAFSSTGLVSVVDSSFAPHPTARMVIAINSKIFIYQNPNMTRNSNQLQNHPKFITVHGRWAGGV